MQLFIVSAATITLAVFGAQSGTCNEPLWVSPSAQCGECTTACQECGPVCGGGAGPCGPQCLPECGVCGTAKCWDCSYEEGIDLESLTPAAQSKQLYEASQARIRFELPEDAGVSLGDQKMGTLGAKRSFIVPILDRTKSYKYELKVDVVRNGKKYFRKIPVPIIRAGSILLVKIEAPPAAEDAIPEIIHELSTEAPGGEPKESEETPN